MRKGPELTRHYASLEAWMYDFFIAERILKLHAGIIEQGKIKSMLEEKRERSLLDVGCGGGQAAIRLKSLYPQLKLVGIDSSAGQISRARERAAQKGYDIRFEVADAQNLPFDAETFDLVYSFGSAKHWPDPLKGVREAWRVLKKSGELLITDAISDVRLEEVGEFYDIAGFPKVLKKPLVRILYKKLFQPSRAFESYRKVAADLKLPADAVSRLPSMPLFLLRTQKS